MPSVNLNLFANLTGNAWSAIISLAFIPLYIRLMGVEAYGLVGIFISLQAVFSVLDLGLSQTLNRELAKLTVDAKNNQLILDTVRTLECIYIICAAVIIVSVVMASGYIASNWLNPDVLSAKDIQVAISIMAAVIGLRWPLTLYIGGLNGLQKQVLLNLIFATFATFQALGAVVVLWFVDSTIQAFFIWQLVIAATQVAAVRYAFFRFLPSGRAGFSLEVLNGIWRFALGVTGVTLLSTILTQLDKLLLSKLLSLEDFGYYVFASTAAAVILKVNGPLFNAFLPKFVQVFSAKNEVDLALTYRNGCQLAAVVIVPISCVLAFFSSSILLLWTQNFQLVSNSAVVFSLLIIGNALNGLIALPYALQLACGWTRLALYQNLLLVVFFAPAVYFSSAQWGGVGAAGAWVVMNFAAMVFGIQVMHARLVRREKLYWHINSVVVPITAGALTCTAVAFIFSGSETTTMLFLKVFLASVASVIAVAFSLPRIRFFLIKAIFRKKLD